MMTNEEFQKLIGTSKTFINPEQGLVVTCSKRDWPSDKNFTPYLCLQVKEEWDVTWICTTDSDLSAAAERLALKKAKDEAQMKVWEAQAQEAAKAKAEADALAEQIQAQQSHGDEHDWKGAGPRLGLGAWCRED